MEKKNKEDEQRDREAREDKREEERNAKMMSKLFEDVAKSMKGTKKKETAGTPEKKRKGKAAASDSEDSSTPETDPKLKAQLKKARKARRESQNSYKQQCLRLEMELEEERRKTQEAKATELKRKLKKAKARRLSAASVVKNARRPISPSSSSNNSGGGSASDSSSSDDSSLNDSVGLVSPVVNTKKNKTTAVPQSKGKRNKVTAEEVVRMYPGKEGTAALRKILNKNKLYDFNSDRDANLHRNDLISTFVAHWATVPG
jgi:hypothetical protein